MKLKVLAVMATLALVGCGSDATVGTLSAVRCAEECMVVVSTSDIANSPKFTEYRACDKDVQKLLARKVILVQRADKNCVTIYDYYQ